jgi:hypothetical protein
VREDLQAKKFQLQNEKRLLEEAILNRSGRLSCWITGGAAVLVRGFMTIVRGGVLALMAAFFFYGATKSEHRSRGVSD